LQLDGRLVLDSCLGNAMAHYVHNVLYWSGVQTPMSWGNVERITTELYRGNDIEGTDTVFVRAAISDGPEVLIGMSHACRDRLTETEWLECEKATIRYTCDGGPKKFTIYWHSGETEEVVFSIDNWVVENFRAYFSYLRGEVDRPLTRLIDSKPFVVLNDLAYIAAKSISTVPSAETDGGVCPANTWPKLMLERSSATERNGASSTSTPAAAVALVVDVPEQDAAAADPLRGVGAADAKSSAFASVSVQPPPCRTAAVVLVSAGAAAVPS
jgi:hypothetical protein